MRKQKFSHEKRQTEGPKEGGSRAAQRTASHHRGIQGKKGKAGQRKKRTGRKKRKRERKRAQNRQHRQHREQGREKEEAKGGAHTKEEFPMYVLL